ncbi:hypothetical protein N9W17_01375 [Jannaschia sp.]|nr:hypothetical protein [Jannaschia sp.]
MNIEILLGGLVGLSFIAVLIYLLTRRSASGGGTASSAAPFRAQSEADDTEKNDQP